jgi:oxepin-CoA hydrolase/3-oxo-5,6-dehydrosuberyl-CoA semialdehyde dehydrogenase
MLKALALHLKAHRKALYELSFLTGATLADSQIDIDGGIGTLLVYASKGRREMPEGFVLPDGEVEMLSRDGSFLGQHVLTPRQGIALQINAFNFPVWGMLEKLAPSLLAGVPSLVKPASDTGYLTQAVVRLIADSGILPEARFSSSWAAPGIFWTVWTRKTRWGSPAVPPQRWRCAAAPHCCKMPCASPLNKTV